MKEEMNIGSSLMSMFSRISLSAPLAQYSVIRVIECRSPVHIVRGSIYRAIYQKQKRKVVRPFTPYLVQMSAISFLIIHFPVLHFFLLHLNFLLYLSSKGGFSTSSLINLCTIDLFL